MRNAEGNDDPVHDLLDGLRLLQAINDEVESEQPWKLMIADSTLGAALVIATPEIPLIFEGQEFLESMAFDVAPGAGLEQGRPSRGMVTIYRDLIRLRRNSFHTTGGLGGG